MTGTGLDNAGTGLDSTGLTNGTYTYTIYGEDSGMLLQGSFTITGHSAA